MKGIILNTTEVKAVCVWTLSKWRRYVVIDEDTNYKTGYYDTECGASFNEGGGENEYDPMENDFCPHCGKRIVVIGSPMKIEELATQKYKLESSHASKIHMDLMRGEVPVMCPYSSGERGDICGSWCALFRISAQTENEEYFNPASPLKVVGYCVTQSCQANPDRIEISLEAQ